MPDGGVRSEIPRAIWRACSQRDRRKESPVTHVDTFKENKIKRGGCLKHVEDNKHLSAVRKGGYNAGKNILPFD